MDEEVKKSFWDDLVEVVRGIHTLRSYSSEEILVATSRQLQKAI